MLAGGMLFGGFLPVRFLHEECDEGESGEKGGGECVVGADAI